MSKKIMILIFSAVLVLTAMSCRKDDRRIDEPQEVLTVDNKLIVGEWKHLSSQLNVYDATTGAAKSNRDYDVPQFQSFTFTADGKYLVNRANSGSYGINAAGTTLTIKDAYGKTSISEVKTLNNSQLIISSTETSENTRLVLVQYFTR